MSQTTNTKPVHVLRRRGVKVSVFENRSGDGVFHKVAVQKVYRQSSSEEWKTASSLGRDDLPIATLLLGRAYEYILDKEAESNHE